MQGVLGNNETSLALRQQTLFTSLYDTFRRVRVICAAFRSSKLCNSSGTCGMLSRYAVAASKRTFSTPTPPFTSTYYFRCLNSRLPFTSTLLDRVHTAFSRPYTSLPMEQNGAHSKRKQPPTPSNERPMKQIKAETDVHSRNGVTASPAAEMDVEDARSDVSLEALPIVPVVGAVHDTAEWQKTIEGVVKSVVSIHFCQTCSFDTDPAIASEATGFVVDAEKGYIMTNRV